jgi:AcrR family transcriptional regulator
LTPQVEDAAERAGISRTTAYRYFPNQRSLLLAAQPQIQPDTLLPADAPSDPKARLDVFMAAFTRYNFDWEPQLRTALRLSLEPGASKPVLRRGRAIGWIEDALAPLRDSHPGTDVHQLAIAIRSAAGEEVALAAVLKAEEIGQAVFTSTVAVAKTSCWPGASASRSRRWPPGWSTRWCCMSCRS